MIRLLQWLIFGHVHEWETIEKVILNWEGFISRGKGYKVYLKCKHCGVWKCQTFK